MWFFKKKRVDHALKELVDGLSQRLAGKLVSILLYGSKASGEYHEGSSDVNLFIVLEDASAETLDLMRKPIREWLKAGHAMPVFVPKEEVSLYADALPVEFLDMQDHHKVIYGSNPLDGLRIDRSNLRAQCLQELSVKQLKLRQAILLVDADVKKLRKVLLDSLPSVLTLYRAVLRLETEVPKGHKIMAAKELALRAGLDGDCLERLWNNHIRRQTDNVGDVAHQYLNSLERTLAYLERK
jgi:predicted nucleotidyltransferase